MNRAVGGGGVWEYEYVGMMCCCLVGRLVDDGLREQILEDNQI